MIKTQDDVFIAPVPMLTELRASKHPPGDQTNLLKNRFDLVVHPLHVFIVNISFTRRVGLVCLTFLGATRVNLRKFILLLILMRSGLTNLISITFLHVFYDCCRTLNILLALDVFLFRITLALLYSHRGFVPPIMCHLIHKG